MFSSPWGRSCVSFKQIGQHSFFRGNWDKGPSSTAPQVCDSGAWPAAPDVIWHIYSRQPCSKGKEAFTSCLCSTPPHTQGRFPVSFEQISLGSFFRGRAQTRSAGAGPGQGQCLIHGRWLPDVIWHILLVPALLHSGGGYGLIVFREGAPMSGEGPLWVLAEIRASIEVAPLGCLPGPRPLKSQLARMEWPPAQTVRGCWRELRAVPLPATWALAGPGERSTVLADGGANFTLSLCGPCTLAPPHKKLHPCPTPLARDTGWEVPIFSPLLWASYLAPRTPLLGVPLTQGYLG